MYILANIQKKQKNSKECFALFMVNFEENEFGSIYNFAFSLTP